MNTPPKHNHTFIKLKRVLQTFQSTRLNKTYSDLMQNPEYADMGDFFFNKLYAPKDFTLRNENIEKLHKKLNGKLSYKIIAAVSKVIELHHLSDSLDNQMVYKMMEYGIGSTINMKEYKRIYKSLDNYDQRIYQINLGAKITPFFHNLSKKWIIIISLETVRKAAHILNIRQTIDFVYEGFNAFRKINDINFFIDTITKREIAWHNEIWKTQEILPEISLNS